ncbi:MAG: DUF2283 domain-containing protein [Cyanobacteria bacterium P01_F01_bin.143]
MKIFYDRKVDALYIKRFATTILESEEISPGVIFDYDKDDNIVGVEVCPLRSRSYESASVIKLPFTEDEKALIKKFCDRIPNY